ncbi:MAG: phosphotransferase [Desulfobacteraceae bacterium]|nr:phosphotransferase [Desulfobacteraceae bacterium]
MDTSKMTCLKKMDSTKSYELLEIAHNLGKVAKELKETLEKTFLREQIIEIVEGSYDIGRVLEAYEIFGGYVNRSFGIVTEKDGKKQNYFLRKYKRGISDDDILFEHAMISHSIAHGLSICPGLIPTREDATFVTPANSRSKFAIYTFLEGEDKYTWDNPIMEDEGYESAARVLATFHNASRDFDPGKLVREEPRILDMLPTFTDTFTTYAQQERDSKFHEYYKGKIDLIISAIKANTIPEQDVAKMPINPIHCDFHPGNLKFEDNKAVGLFDFDWSKIDLRLFEIGLALVYCASRWDEDNDGTILLDKCKIFMASYQASLTELGGLAPMNETELDNFPTMMAMANFYILNWDITAYYAEEDLNDYEYLAYLKHNVRLLEWIEANKGGLAKIADSLKP